MSLDTLDSKDSVGGKMNLKVLSRDGKTNKSNRKRIKWLALVLVYFM